MAGECRNAKFIPTENQYFDLVIHHGGNIVELPCRKYEGGEISRIEQVDEDYVSLQGIAVAVKKLGYIGVDSLHYAQPGLVLDVGLWPLTCDEEIRDACYIGKLHGEVHIYVTHIISIHEPVEAEVLMLSYTNASQHVEGSNLDGDTVCGVNVDEGTTGGVNVDGGTTGGVNVNGATRGGNQFDLNDDWWDYNQTEIEELMSKSQKGKC